MGIIFGFLPFIIFFILASTVSPLAGLVAGFLVSVYFAARSRQLGSAIKILDIGSVTMFGLLALFQLLVKPNLGIGITGTLVTGGLMLTSLISLAIGRPFTLQYAREQVPQEYWNLPVFIKTNRLITAAWTLAFAISTVANAAATYSPSFPHWVGITASVLGFLWAIWFTRWYPARVRRLRTGDA
jgi:hypothetical protein